MKTAPTGFIGSLVALSCITVFAGVNSDAAKDTETLDKLKVIETINVTSSKEIDETKSDKIDGEVLKILKVADQDEQGLKSKTKSASDKLKVIETINVTSPKKIDETKGNKIDVEVSKILKAADQDEQGLKSKTKSASDKLKVIETINVTSPKKIDETKGNKIDVEVSKILKAADQDEQGLKSKTKSASDKLKVIETINVTSPKKIDDTNSDEVHGEVLEILEQVDQEFDEAADAESTYGKLYLSEKSKTISLTVIKDDNGAIEDVEVDVIAEHEIEWVQEADDEAYDTETQIRAQKRSKEIESKKSTHRDEETETK